MSIEEREAARRARREAKADRVEGWAEARQRHADAKLGAAQQTADMIPLGQPILVGHYSERRHRRDIERMQANTSAGFEHQRKAQEHARRAEGIRRWEEERLTAPVTIRRIAKLEAEARRIARAIDGWVGEDRGDWWNHLVARGVAIGEELDYWRQHLARLEAEGVKLWGPADFTVGDRVLCPHPGTVVKVNAKTLRVRIDVMPQFPSNVRYDKIKGKEAPHG